MSRILEPFSAGELAQRGAGGLSEVAPDLDAAAEALAVPGLDTAPLRPAAVLVPIRQRAAGATVILTVRSADMPSHAGQIAFPGGGIAPGESARAAALREADEEIGLSAADVRVLGFLDAYRIGSGYVVAPVVGLIAADFVATPHAREVAAVFEVPLPFLMDPANHRVEEAEWRGRRRRFHVMHYGDYRIWGATAGMLKNLYDRIYGTCSA